MLLWNDLFRLGRCLLDLEIRHTFRTLFLSVQISWACSSLAGCCGTVAHFTSVAALGTTRCTGQCSQSTFRLKSAMETSPSSSTWRGPGHEPASPTHQSLVSRAWKYFWWFGSLFDPDTCAVLAHHSLHLIRVDYGWFAFGKGRLWLIW